MNYKDYVKPAKTIEAWVIIDMLEDLFGTIHDDSCIADGYGNVDISTLFGDSYPNSYIPFGVTKSDNPNIVNYVIQLYNCWANGMNDVEFSNYMLDHIIGHCLWLWECLDEGLYLVRMDD